VQVLDARDPLGTRSKHVERHLKKNAAHKHLIFVLNKVDLVPSWVTRKWVRLLSADYPTLAMHAHINKPFGKGALIQLLRQYALLHPEKKQISVGFIGYPNAGKSSIINTLRSKKVCKVAPIPGETKVWQYITLFKRVFLIDCPGVVYPSDDNESDIVMKGVVRSERLDNPEDYVPAILDKVRREYVVKTYGVDEWKDAEDFLKQLALKRGRMRKGGEADLRSVAQQVINDLQRGRLPYFVPPPEAENNDATPQVEVVAEEEEGQAQKLNPTKLDVPVQDMELLPQSEVLGGNAAEQEDDIEEKKERATRGSTRKTKQPTKKAAPARGSKRSRQSEENEESTAAPIAKGKGKAKASARGKAKATKGKGKAKAAVNWDDMDLDDDAE
jgi:nuclear GTP-binding protein